MVRRNRGVSTSVIISVVAVVLAALVAVWVEWRHHTVSGAVGDHVARPALRPEQQAYLPSIAVTDFRMSAANNFLGDTVTYLDGIVTNRGTKFVRRVDVELNFVDSLNQVVLRETAHPLTERNAPLQPGETRAFRVTFEHMPVDWNQAPPTVKPVFVEF